MDNTLLLTFLLVNALLIGALATVAIQHAIAHFRPHEADKKQPPKPAVSLPPAVKEKLLLAAEANFQKMLDHSASELQRDLKATTTQMNTSLQKLAADIINDEMKRYRQSLDELRAQTEMTIGGAQKEVESHQADLEVKFAERQKELQAKLEADIEAERQVLIQQIDTKLSDAVASFLIDTLGHDVDLGAQSAYLTKLLDEHKDDFKQGVVHGETDSTK